MMPEGLLQALEPDEARDLIAYLRTAEQVPLPDPEDAPADPDSTAEPAAE